MLINYKKWVNNFKKIRMCNLNHGTENKYKNWLRYMKEWRWKIDKRWSCLDVCSGGLKVRVVVEKEEQ